MKNDDFEKQLQKQELRPVPEHWRNQILHTARATGVKTPVRSEQTLKDGLQRSWLGQLLWPCPQAWGALATVWVVALFFSVAGSEKEPSVAAVKGSVESREVMMAV